MKQRAHRYYDDLRNFIDSVKVTDRESNVLSLEQGIESACALILQQMTPARKLIFIGNGASASISSHMATDFWKNGGIRAVAFNDSSLLTCIGNDYGYPQVFEKPVEMFADRGDILFAISSSGKSENILRGVRSACAKECRVVTLSGFSGDNPLNVMGDLNFYVPSQSYGPVEIIHHSICHCILDVLMMSR